MSVFEVDELIKYVRENSPFYKELYSDLDENTSLEKLPITDQEKFWKANTLNNNLVLTSKKSDGVVFKSGGTTGNPKFSIFTQGEWEKFTSDFGQGMDQLRLKEGDLCANLFYSGDLYASFLFINKSVEKMSTKVTQFPITGQTDIHESLKIISDYKVNVLFGVPTSLINMATHSNEVISHVDQIYYGGEPLFDDQKELLLKTFPNAYISSIGYASVDGGQLGYVDSECGAGEHKVFKSTIMEIIDPETGELIKEKGRVGKLIFTNLTRKLMPIIKYPVGDMASWVEYGEKFKLLGRSDEGARVGPVTVNRDDILKILETLEVNNLVDSFQLIIERKESKDCLQIVLGSLKESKLEECLEKLDLKNAFYEQRKMYQKEVQKGLIGDIEYSVVNTDNLVKNPRTGKLRLVIDQRHN
jgi:phenylacetate-CoA ligase